MSANGTFAFQNVIVFPHTRRACACACVFAEDSVRQMHEPVVTARWTIETSQDGTRRLVRHWFENAARPDSSNILDSRDELAGGPGLAVSETGESVIGHLRRVSSASGCPTHSRFSNEWERAQG